LCRSRALCEVMGDSMIWGGTVSGAALALSPVLASIRRRRHKPWPQPRSPAADGWALGGNRKNKDLQ